MIRNLRLMAVAAALVATAVATPRSRAEIPPPAKMAAGVIVSGRTSTARNVETAWVGQEIPKTFSGDRLKNCPKFSWWVSRHYALKTDYPEEKARFYLTLLEQAYPFYVELFGREIPGLDEKRMAVCYASSKRGLRQAMDSDGMAWDFQGGGITFDGLNCSYAYPSGDLDYHKRYIVLHECTHLYQQCLAGSTYNTPPWFFEGVADALASHVYDTARRQLTVCVLDKPTTTDFFDAGMTKLQQPGVTAEMIHDTGDRGGTARGLPFLLVHFLMDDPDRLQKFRLWRDEMFRANKRDRCLAESSRLITELFGPWSRINADFKAWTSARRQTFHYAEWGWEQDADTPWSYGFAKEGRLSETDVFLAPGDKPAYAPWRMDYPLQPMSPLVGPVERGTAEPSVGCLIDFSRTPRKGCAGLGMGVILGPSPPPRNGEEGKTEGEKPASGVKVITIGPEKPAGPAAGYLAVLVDKGEELVIDGAALGMKPERTAIPAEVQGAMAAGGHQVGLTVRIAPAALVVTLRARDPKAGAPAEWQATCPLTAAQRQRLLAQPLALLSRGGRHGVTPYFDDRRRPEPDLTVPAPPNRWRNPGDPLLDGLYHAARRLGAKTPASLTALREKMRAAADKDPAAQQEAVAAYEKAIAQVQKDVESCGAAAEAVRAAVDALRPPAQAGAR